MSRRNAYTACWRSTARSILVEEIGDVVVDLVGVGGIGGEQSGRLALIVPSMALAHKGLTDIANNLVVVRKPNIPKRLIIGIGGGGLTNKVLVDVTGVVFPSLTAGAVGVRAPQALCHRRNRKIIGSLFDRNENARLMGKDEGEGEGEREVCSTASS
jgi:hypothetical protein